MIADQQPRFHICTLVTNWPQYEAMKATFLDAGFDSISSRYTTFDNSHSNKFEPYSLINRLMVETPESYLILCHQDILLDQGHGRERLEQIVEELEQADPRWAVLGNAGCTDTFEFVVRIVDPTRWQDLDNPLTTDRPLTHGKMPPQPVHSLDENFLVLKTAAKVHASPQLSGFHLYATDLCLNARLAGHTCYVVDFNLTHLSPGNFGEDFQKARLLFIERWNREFHFLYIIRGAEIFLSRWRLARRLGPRSRVRRMFLNSPLLRKWMTRELQQSQGQGAKIKALHDS